jgi:hypothetical protein
MGGTALWTSVMAVTPANGLFTVYLGDPAVRLDDSVLLQAAFIGVTVGGNPEMTPRQALNTIVGHSEGFAGVIGHSVQAGGVYGNSSAGIGVLGTSHSGDGVGGSSDLSYGVVGSTSDATKAGVLAQAAGNSGIALEISTGGIKATGAGGDTNTFAFIHVVSDPSLVSNCLNSSCTLINNMLTNSDRNAMLFVTHVNNPPGVTPNGFNRAFGVYYDTNASKWAIYAEDGGALVAGFTFNVMVIKR